MSQGKETSLELRNLIVKLKGENKSYSKIVRKPRSTVQTIYRNYVMRENVLNKSRCGHPHKLGDRDARAIEMIAGATFERDLANGKTSDENYIGGWPSLKIIIM
ncbi:hypothetical protein TNIN_111521 [Trichonephila inaurata madagascariensis]|uniref:Uncharacterized protein n=1 Tax=Trichonephila inaurata madagascariensis TaxID=2747483 RepID=A0A8X6XEZ4_9ARAC|nr:hypothetical protein TNIN_111521 [Trichonephila inaurata madagascariensis]